MAQGKKRPDRLDGTFENRVFVGGQYDFMPVLRQIAQYVKDVSPPGREFVPIIPYDYDIKEEQTMDWDLAILGQCRYAIFDLSDLGAQLVEMQEAKQKQTMVSSLVVYPVRDKERRHEPERGKRTVYSFGLPYFGYVKLEELKDVIGRFLHGGPRSNDWATGRTTDPHLEKTLRHVKLYRGSGELERAWLCLPNIVDILADKKGEIPFKLLLEKGLIGNMRVKQVKQREEEIKKSGDGSNISADFQKNKEKLIKETDEIFKAAQYRATLNSDKAELAYYRGLVAELTDEDDIALKEMQRAIELAPNDGRFPFHCGYLTWRVGVKNTPIDESKLKEAIDLTERALSLDIDDPLTDIFSRNNLAYFYCEMAKQSGDTDKNKRMEYINKALKYSQGLPSYHRVFRRMHGYWFDTRAWALLLQAKEILEEKREGDLDILIDAFRGALELFDRAVELDRQDSDIMGRWEWARSLRKEISDWLHEKAQELQSRAQELQSKGMDLQSKELSENSEKYRSVADEFYPPLQ